MDCESLNSVWFLFFACYVSFQGTIVNSEYPSMHSMSVWWAFISEFDVIKFDVLSM